MPTYRPISATITMEANILAPKTIFDFAVKS